MGRRWCLLVCLLAGALAAASGTRVLRRAPLRQHVQPTAVVAMSLLELEQVAGNVTDPLCKAGFKCPLDGGVCCKGGTTCCPFGCDKAHDEKICLPNKIVNVLQESRNEVAEHARKKAMREFAERRLEKKTKVAQREADMKTAQEAREKRVATEFENERKQRVREKLKSSQVAAAKEVMKQVRNEEGKMREEANKQFIRKLPLKNRMVPYFRDYREPQYSEVSNLCVLSGMAEGPDQKTVLAKLPPGCQPAGRLVFDVHTASTDTARYDIQADGSIRWVGGAANSGSSEARYISFDGMAFVPNGAQQLTVPLSSTWVPYGELEYQDPLYSRFDDLCVISGLTRTELWRAEAMQNPVFVLGPDCQPDRRLVFLVNSQRQSFRFDILPNGEGRLIGTQGRKHDVFVSLAGLIFFKATHGTKRLELQGKWVSAANTTGQYREPTWHRRGTYCVLSGVARAAKGAWSPHIATIPQSSGCWPEAKVTFTVNAWPKGDLQGTGQIAVQRIDVLPNGELRWMAGLTSDWVSFDGIRFWVPS